MRSDPPTLFLILGSLLGIAYAFATPPMQVPDERRHLLRVAQIAEGGIVDGATIPASIDRFARRARPPDSLKARDRARSFSLAKLADVATIPLQRDDGVHLPADRAVVYSPVSYLSGVAGVRLALTLDARPLVLLYVARLSLLAGGLALLYAAIRLAPTYRWTLCFLALLPATTFLRSGVSADTMTTAFGFLLFALLMRLRAPGATIGAGQIAVLAGVGSGLALCKAGYLPLTAACVALPRERFGSRQAYLRAVAWAVGVPVLVSVVWWLALGDWIAHDNPPRADADRQMAMLLREPGAFLSALADTWLSAERYVRLAGAFVGRVLVLSVPELLVPLLVVALLALLTRSGEAAPPDVRERVVYGAVVLACLLLISVGAYVKWSAPGATSIRGIQGRYLYPLAPFLLVALLPPQRLRWRGTAATAGAIVALAAIASNGAALARIVASAWDGVS